MKVFVLEVGVYNDRYIAGIYATPEAAMAAQPVPKRPIIQHGSTFEREGGWREDPRDDSWDNGLDWDDAASITPYEVLDGGGADAVDAA